MKEDYTNSDFLNKEIKIPRVSWLIIGAPLALGGLASLLGFLDLIGYKK